MTQTETRAAAPWHLWVVGILSLLWNSYGAFDYVMSQTRNEAYMAAITEPFGFSTSQAIDYFDSFPLWADAAWALGVWGSVIGSLLLLARQRYAMHSYAISLIGLVVCMAYQYANPMVGASDSVVTIVMSAVVLAIVLALYFYAKRMIAKRVLV